MTIAARSAIVAKVKAVIAAGRPGLALQDDPNFPFTPPSAAPWVRLSFVDGDERQTAINAPTAPFSAPLLAYLDIFGPAGSGDGDVVAVAALLTDGLRRFSAAGLRWSGFQTGPEGAGSGAEAAFYRKQLIAVFTLSFRG